jgi:UDP-N-acetylmuramyl pentapeptide phosphotransferase/UDP-N-acetylglucosamine-1-phosphate transferase
VNSISLRVGVTALATTFVAVGLFQWYARHRRLLDVPNERSSHTTPTPRSGGVGIAVGVLVAVLMLQRHDFEEPWRQFEEPWVVAGLFGVTAMVGFVDDVRGMKALEKFVALISLSFPLALVWRWEVVRGVPFLGDLVLFGGIATVVPTVLCLALYSNAFNFMDGINGIASLTAAVTGAVFAVAGVSHGDPTLARWGAVAAGASLGFLPWNFPKARVFMGDAGSLPLGLLLIVCAGMAAQSNALPLPASILLLGPFLFDVTFTLIRRVIENKTIGAPHKEHLYQRLSRVWHSHAKVSLLYAGFSCVTGALALAYASMSDVGKLLSLVLPTAAMLGFAALVLRAERVKGR